MKEIKIRAYDKIGRNMVDWLTLRQTAFNRGDHQLLYKVLVHHADNFHIMFFTGKQDVNKKDIYIGDTLEVTNTITSSISKYEVGWDEDSCKVYLIDAERDGDEFGVYTRNFGLRNDKYEIIGNIYDNK